MKKLLLFVFVSMVALNVFAQIKDPVSWKYEAKKISPLVYALTITATVERPWHIYSQNTGKGGPIPTKITFKANPLITVSGTAKEKGKLEKVFDENFKTNVLYFADKVEFVQTVKLKSNVKTSVSGTVEYMVCDDQQCLPPTTKKFDIKLL
jgi:thiol:disulfide interchange protein DsbD